jgi:hypothetical protein
MLFSSVFRSFTGDKSVQKVCPCAAHGPKLNQYPTESCAICLENFADAPDAPTRLLACGHTLHTDCLGSWKRGSCPICRAELELGPTDPLRVEPDKKFHKALRWPNIITAMRTQQILTGVNDAEKMMAWFGATDCGFVSVFSLEERLKDATPMTDVYVMMHCLLEEADYDGDGKLNLQDFKLLLQRPQKVSYRRYCAISLF